jgi:hypothetical protein
LQEPKQEAASPAVESVSFVGCLMVTVSIAEQPLASFTVMVYRPAMSPDANAELPPLGVQEYVRAPEPPEAVAMAEPLAPPLQLTGVEEGILTTIGPGCVMVMLVLVMHPLASVTVQVWLPGHNPLTVGVAAAPEFQE